MANVLLNHYDDILASLNTIRSEWSERFNNAFDGVRKAENMIANWEHEKNKLYLNHAEELLMSEGLTFPDKLGSFELRYDQDINNIRTIKVIDTSTSGKTATIEVEQYYSYQDELVKRTFEKVRVSKLKDFLWQYRDYVILADLKVLEEA